MSLPAFDLDRDVAIQRVANQLREFVGQPMRRDALRIMNARVEAFRVVSDPDRPGMVSLVTIDDDVRCADEIVESYRDTVNRSVRRYEELKGEMETTRAELAAARAELAKYTAKAPAPRRELDVD